MKLLTSLLSCISTSIVSIDQFSMNAGSHNLAGGLVCHLLVGGTLLSVLSSPPDSTAASSRQSSRLLSVAIDSIDEWTSAMDDVLLCLIFVDDSGVVLCYVDDSGVVLRFVGDSESSSSWMILRVVRE